MHDTSMDLFLCQGLDKNTFRNVLDSFDIVIMLQSTKTRFFLANCQEIQDGCHIKMLCED